MIGLTRLKETPLLAMDVPDGGEINIDGKIVLRTKTSINLTAENVSNDLKVTLTTNGKTDVIKAKKLIIIPNTFLTIKNIEKEVTKKYEEEIIIRGRDGILLAINKIGFNKYLTAVVAKEIGPESDIEALKAQALVSRSYAIFNLRKHKKNGFNVCDSRFACCQAYDGTYKTFNQKVYDAVLETEKEILTFQGKCMEAVFHSCCGGRTCIPSDVWPNTDENKQFISVKDIDNAGNAYCKNSPRFKWETKLSKNIIIQCFDLHESKEKVLLIKNNSGDITYICMGDKKMTVMDFRRKLAQLGYKGIDSNFFNIIAERNDSYVFSGYGFGHRIGMCQSGAKEMAKRGFNYKEIINHYYPNCDISNWRSYEKDF
ncbi:MAG: SpoIID/LytB domain-containing protein [Elusimicrobia bacterium]|nr:SpoIID/LytB domain-containing protein [Elusimicrobiota bacterium]